MAALKRVNMITLELFKTDTNIEVIDPPHAKDLFEAIHQTKEVEFDLALKNIDKTGMFLEFGVYEGRTISYCAKITPEVTWHGFDSFEGLPEDWDLGTKVREAGYFALPTLPNVPSNVKLHKGFFNQSLPGWKEANLNVNSHISFLHLDADLYSSTIYVLEQLNDYIKPGCIIRFDEIIDFRYEGFVSRDDMRRPKAKFRYTTWRDGEFKALNEWLQKYNRDVKILWRNWHQGAGLMVTK